jgi:hypothetical protein
MSASFKNRRTLRLLLGSLSICMFAVTSVGPINVYGQVPGKVRSLDVEFVPEPGCPVAVTNGRADLDLDPFDVPIDARIYIDYKNISERAISAVKFRLRFTDPEMKDRGTWHAPDMELLAPGATGTEKWKHEKVDPRATSLKVRILQVKYQDNSHWMSAKMSELANPSNPSNFSAGATGGGGGGGGAPQAQPRSNSIIPDIPQQQAPPSNAAPPANAGGQAAPASEDPFSIGR